MVFQDFKLIGRKSALENVAYVLNVAGLPPGEPTEDGKAPVPLVPGYVWVMTGVFVLGGGVALARNMGWTKGIETRIRRLR